MIFYDFEVFAYDWLVVVMDMTAKKTHVIINSPEELEALYKANIREIWCGFNSRHYDQYILKAILCGFDPKKVFLSTPSARRATAKTETKSLFSNKLYNILHEFRRALIYNGSKNYPNHAK